MIEQGRDKPLVELGVPVAWRTRIRRRAGGVQEACAACAACAAHIWRSVASAGVGDAANGVVTERKR